MQDEFLKAAAERPYAPDQRLRSEGVYEGATLPLPGEAEVRVTTDAIAATIRNTTDWENKAFRELPPGTFLLPGGLFRPAVPGRLIRREHYGKITSRAGWTAHQALYVGQTAGPSSAESTFRFTIDDLEVPGPAAGATVVAQRNLYRRASFYIATEVDGDRIVAMPRSDSETSIEGEMMAVTFERTPSEIHQEATWHALNLLAGNTLELLASESLADSGNIVTTHYHSRTARDIRREFFHRRFPDYGCLARDGFRTLLVGFRRLLLAKFPIDIVLHHLHDAAGQPNDIEGQHLVLAIHAAIEAWNRHFGCDYWLDSAAWEPVARKLRKPMKQVAEYQALSDRMKANIASAMAHANETTTSWRQEQLFDALQIDVSDSDNKRALKLRNALLHDGYFRPRWSELTHKLREERLHDIERLRRLTLLIVFKLTGYSGDFTSPITFMREHVDSGPVAQIATDEFWMTSAANACSKVGKDPL